MKYDYFGNSQQEYLSYSYKSFNNSRKMNKRIVLLTLLLSLFSLKSMATVWYVDSANVSGYQDGTEWAYAFTNPQLAINVASAGDSVWIAKGTYQPIVNTSYSMKEGVRIFGGFLNTYTSFVQRNWQMNITILKGNGSRVINNDANGLTAAAVLDGFTITKGINSSFGGGMYNNLASPTVRNCIFYFNDANNLGGGIYSNSALSLQNCLIRKNTATYGGGIFASDSLSLTDCIVDTNSADVYGGGINASGAVNIINSSLNANHCYYYVGPTGPDPSHSGGGGIYKEGVKDLIVNNSTISRDSVHTTYDSRGGGIYNAGTGKLTIIDCNLEYNATGASINSSYGGAIYSNGPVVIQGTAQIKKNFAAKAGGIYTNSTLRAINTTIKNNKGSGIYCNSQLIMSNSTVDSNTLGGITCNGSLPDSLINCSISYNTSDGLVDSAIAYIKNCIVRKNGRLGMYIMKSATVYNCTIDSNFSGGISAIAPLSIDSSSINANSLNIVFPGLQVGGINSNSRLAVNHSVINGNRNNIIGGGLYLTGDTCLITNSVITNNIGGGIYSGYYYPNALLYVNNCDVSSNYDGSGGIDINSVSSRITNCTIKNNKSPVGGGVTYVGDATYKHFLSNCIFSKDSSERGGAIFAQSTNPVIVNCLFSQNNADSFGGAFYFDGASSLLVNNTIINNKAVNAGAIYNKSNSVPTIVNTIIWGNNSGITNDVTSTVNTKYSLIQGYPGNAVNHGISGTTNPLFVDTAAGNYQLQSTSPCINVGNNDSIPSGITTDLAGGARIYNTIVDMGAYEFGSTPLPISFLKLTGRKQTDHSNLLQWYTTNENAENFDLQRSVDGKEFVTFYQVNANTADQQYNYIDEQPESYSYYRVLTKEKDGNRIYSNIVFIATENLAQSFTVYPNPATESLAINCPDIKLMNTQATLTDAYGRVVKTITIANNLQRLSLSGLSKGVYILKMQNGQTLKIVKE